MAAKQKQQRQAKPSGDVTPEQRALAEAMAHEDAIAEEAAKLRGDAKELTPELFMQLWPLLRKPIPPGFIVTEPATKGKPYDSTGVKSVQVCVDRMDNVLTPLWWWDKASYEDDGKRCQVTVCVGSDRSDALVVRRSQGGVNQGSTIGNVYKGSYTNAAKRAFALLGVGHEVYLGAPDYDPDVNAAAAEAQEPAAGKIATITAEQAAELRDRFDGLPGGASEHTRDLKLLLGSIGVSARSVNAAFAKLTPTQMEVVSGWIEEQAGEAEGSPEGGAS